MFDMEFLRNQQLIEERIEYENDFISILDIIKSGAGLLQWPSLC